MSAEKAKIYQGVRVKTTVKELLQKHRALQALSAATNSHPIGEHEVCTATSPSRQVFSERQAPETFAQTRLFSEQAAAPLESAYDHHQMFPVMPPETFLCPAPAPWSNGYLPPNTDFYGASLVSRSPSDSLYQPSTADYNSYSPPQSDSSSSSCYNSPKRMDLSCSFTPENFHYQQFGAQQWSCLSPWSASPDAASAEHAQFPSADCWFSYGEDSFIRRDIPNSEMCYL